MIPVVLGLAGLAALLFRDSKDNPFFTDEEVEKTEDMPPLTSEETKALKKLVGKAEMSLVEMIEALENWIPPGFDFWIATEKGGNTSIHWQWIEGDNGGYIGKLTDDNLLNLLKSVREVNWNRQIEASQDQAERFRGFSRELHEIKSRLNEPSE